MDPLEQLKPPSMAATRKPPPPAVLSFLSLFLLSRAFLSWPSSLPPHSSRHEPGNGKLMRPEEEEASSFSMALAPLHPARIGVVAAAPTPSPAAAADGSPAPAPTQGEVRCDLFDGSWVYDPAGYPLYDARECPFLSDQVTCRRNGRPDSGYEHWRWQPRECAAALRLGGGEMLEQCRDKRVVLVGDSLNRNMWESLACILYAAAPDRSRALVDDASADYKIFRALDYNCTVEFYWSPFLVDLDEQTRALRLDRLPAATYRRLAAADVLVFNTGHWWTHTGKFRAWDHLEKNGEKVEMGAEEALNRALRTWTRWLDRSVDSDKTMVFFRSISPEHKNTNWCYNETAPMATAEEYVEAFPRGMVSAVERNLRRARTAVACLNITRLSELRRDAHPSVFTARGGKVLTAEQRRQPGSYADCSHWCLPGLPDSWNLLLFASWNASIAMKMRH
uniref:Uncharacterized protein n=1 Tax=Oryza brachyantha TaxID=4533 RepID=J3MA90_ORYBR